MNDLPQIPQSCLTGSDIAVSFEFFPPRNAQAGEQFWRALGRLELLGPRFASVTSGALGSSRDATRETVLRMRQVSRLEPAAHVTCMGASAADSPSPDPISPVSSISNRPKESGLGMMTPQRI